MVAGHFLQTMICVVVLWFVYCAFAFVQLQRTWKAGAKLLLLQPRSKKLNFSTECYGGDVDCRLQGMRFYFHWSEVLQNYLLKLLCTASKILARSLLQWRIRHNITFKLQNHCPLCHSYVHCLSFVCLDNSVPGLIYQFLCMQDKSNAGKLYTLNTLSPIWVYCRNSSASLH